MGATRVLHLVPTMQRRGAEVFAADLVRALDGADLAQLVVVLRPQVSDEVEYCAPMELLGGGRTSESLPRSTLARMSSLRRIVRRWRPDVIQAHGGEALTASVLIGVGAPIVYRRIGGAPASLRRGWRRLVYTRLVARTARVVAVADAVRDESISLLGIPPSRIVTIPNAVDPDRLIPSGNVDSIRRSLGIEPSTPTFLSVGALTWEKDPLALLRIGSAASAQWRSVHLLLGDGPMRARIEREVAARRLQDRVRVLGARDDVADLVSMADVLLFASRPDGMEGMPGALIEAGIAGTPAVAYDVAGVREVVLDGQTGRVLPWGNEEALANALLDLLRNAAVRRRMGADARHRCLSEFSIARIAPQYLKLYQDVSAA